MVNALVSLVDIEGRPESDVTFHCRGVSIVDIEHILHGILHIFSDF